MRRSGGVVRTLIFGGLLAVVVYAVIAAIGLDLFPFQTTERDHSPPPILTELRELSDLHAAEAEFEVVVDQEQDVRFVPQAIAGERVQFVAVGTVDAVVDLTRLPTDAVRYDAETDSAIVYLPRPTIAQPVLDMDQSHVMNRDRGLLNRLGGMFVDNPTSEAGLYEAAQEKMAAAANAHRSRRHGRGAGRVAARADGPPARRDHGRGALLRRCRAAGLRHVEVLLTIDR